MSDARSSMNALTGQTKPISIGVITIEGRELALLKLLEKLKISCDQYEGICEIVICNNSGAEFKNTIEQKIASSGIEQAGEVTLIQSPENNIAVGRNQLYEHSKHNWLAFIDDDEYPSEQWLVELALAIDAPNTHIVAGPVFTYFPDDTPQWIVRADLHNTKDRIDGTEIQYTNTGNILIDKSSVPDPTFDVEFGKSGGSDTEFFQRNIDQGLVLRWATKAVVYEDVEAKRANTKFMIRRFMNQGRNYRTIKTLHGKVGNQFLFTVRSYIVGLLSIPIALVLLAVKHEAAGVWLKRAFSNLGKVISPSKLLYD